MAGLEQYRITSEEQEARRIEGQPKRPTDSIRSGGGGFSWKQLQQSFDALPALIVERFNALLAAVSPLSHLHKREEIVDFPAALPADGGNADTLAGKSLQEIYEEIPVLPGVENAQKLEGKPASAFLLREGDSMQGDIVFPAGKGICGGETAIPMLYKSEAGGVYVGVTGSQGDDLYLCAGNGKGLFAQVAGENARIWHQGNDGDGSGLDADTLDGLEAVAFAPAAHQHMREEIADFPAALPANGGDADTLGGMPRKNAYSAAEGQPYVPTITSSGTLSIGKRIYFHNEGSTADTDGTIQLVGGKLTTSVGLGLANAGENTLGSPYWGTAAATSAPNAIFYENGALRRTSGSSRRFKRNIADLPEGEADAVLGLRPVRFEFKLDAPGVTRNGFIAEEVMEVAPQFVDRTTLEDGTVQCDNVRYGEITAALVSIVKRQQTRIAALEKRMMGEG